MPHVLPNMVSEAKKPLIASLAFLTLFLGVLISVGTYIIVSSISSNKLAQVPPKNQEVGPADASKDKFKASVKKVMRANKFKTNSSTSDRTDLNTETIDYIRALDELDAGDSIPQAEDQYETILRTYEIASDEEGDEEGFFSQDEDDEEGFFSQDEDGEEKVNNNFITPKGQMKLIETERNDSQNKIQMFHVLDELMDLNGFVGHYHETDGSLDLNSILSGDRSFARFFGVLELKSKKYSITVFSPSEGVVFDEGIIKILASALINQNWTVDLLSRFEFAPEFVLTVAIPSPKITCDEMIHNGNDAAALGFLKISNLFLYPVKEAIFIYNSNRISHNRSKRDAFASIFDFGHFLKSLEITHIDQRKFEINNDELSLHFASSNSSDFKEIERNIDELRSLFLDHAWILLKYGFWDPNSMIPGNEGDYAFMFEFNKGSPFSRVLDGTNLSIIGTRHDLLGSEDFEAEVLAAKQPGTQGQTAFRFKLTEFTLETSRLLPNIIVVETSEYRAFVKGLTSKEKAQGLTDTIYEHLREQPFVINGLDGIWTEICDTNPILKEKEFYWINAKRVPVDIIIIPRT